MWEDKKVRRDIKSGWLASVQGKTVCRVWNKKVEKRVIYYGEGDTEYNIKL
jgi:hypothetical protein